MLGTAIKHPVSERVKPSYVIFDIRALRHPALTFYQIWCIPDVCTYLFSWSDERSLVVMFSQLQYKQTNHSVQSLTRAEWMLNRFSYFGSLVYITLHNAQTAVRGCISAVLSNLPLSLYGFIRKSVKLGYQAKRSTTSASICNDADCKLFTRITGNTQHLLYPLLSMNASITTLSLFVNAVTTFNFLIGTHISFQRRKLYY